MRRRLTHAVEAKLGRARARRLALPLAAIGVVALAIGIVVASELPSSSKGAGPPATNSGGATVERRDLVATDTESGTLGYSGSRTVYDRVSGTITWLPSVGQVIKPGQALYKINNSPVVLFDGTTPAYRDLTSSDSAGPDILELNRDLVALGFAHGEITVNDTWQTGTTDAIDRWQASLGETQTGTITLGRVVFLPGPQLITSLSGVLGSSGGGSGSGNGSAASTTVSPSRPEFVSLNTTRDTPLRSADSTGTTGPTGPTGPSGSHGASGGNGSAGATNAQLRALIALMQAEIAELRSSHGSGNGNGGSHGSGGNGGSHGGNGNAGSHGGGSGGGGAGGSGGGSGGSGGGGSGGGSGGGGGGSGSGSGGGAATAIMQTTSTQEVVTVQLDATKQSEAVVGERVSVQLPDGSTVDGRITRVSPVAQSSSSGSGGSGNGNGNSGNSGNGNGNGNGNGGSGSASATIPVTITLIGHTHLSGLDQAAVSVNFAQQRANNVLTVPVTALIATQGGGYSVQEAAAPHHLIPVTPGLFAAGYVQISGAGLYPGLRVTDSQG